LTFKEKIKSQALDLGFSYCGFANAEALVQESEWLIAYLQRKPSDALDYLSASMAKRLDPRLVIPNAKTVIVLLQNYYSPQFQDEETGFIIARYAFGKDYHFVIREKLDQMVRFMKTETNGIRAKAFVDSGPVMEKAWAQRAGAGWIGKNTLLLNRSAGSFFFIGVILTDLELEPDEPESDHCGSCNKCVEACPTGALELPYTMNPGKCISFWTIESKMPIPEELGGKFHSRIYGCDICQDACPFNKFAIPNTEPAFAISDDMKKLKKEDWLGMTEVEFVRIFNGTPLIRAGYDRVLRTVRMLWVRDARQLDFPSP
jgi:epoxyqueuosine reductase